MERSIIVELRQDMIFFVQNPFIFIRLFWYIWCEFVLSVLYAAFNLLIFCICILYFIIYSLYTLLSIGHFNGPRREHTLFACSMVCSMSCHLPGNPKLVCPLARLIQEGVCVDLSTDTVHLIGPLVFFGSEGSALTLPLFLLSSRIIMLYKDHFLIMLY